MHVEFEFRELLVIGDTIVRSPWARRSGELSIAALPCERRRAVVRQLGTVVG